MNPHDESHDENQIASLLKTVDTGAAPPDAEALARLRIQTTDTFASQPPATTLAGIQPPKLARWERWVGGVAAVILVAVAAALWFSPGPSFGQVLANFENAETVRLRVLWNDEQYDVLHSMKPARSRWDDGTGQTRIATAAGSWLLHEKENVARRTPASSDANQPVLHFLDMLRITHTKSLMNARPVGTAKNGALVYRAELPTPDGMCGLVAFVNPRTLRLISLTARIEKAGKRIREGELTVLAYDEPIAAEKFAIADTLTEDGRIGKVTDLQGLVTIKPVLGERWTPVRAHLVLRPGDWLRTDARGANATALRLVKKTDIILGPKTLVELIGPKQVRLIEGEIEITPSAGATIELLGPGSQKIAVKSRQFYQARKQQLVRVTKDPPWLLGFKGATTNEALGSLVALVDGRNVPLTVGYHKVSVDIRDQIARTVIEESFVNHTNAVLEGVFYFPLPPDASISGFGMWIGDNLVEADVVEKQRAREIYETILRERRDPGLLEWSGGNIFKARVFPIPAGGEKRIKISYTQVLPLKGSRYRYSYALQSELLQKHPLRELSIDVKVNSAIPLKSVTSPMHPTRDEKTNHSAHVEFTAQEYTPTRDFEVVIETEERRGDVVMIPHQRGDDGYFMLQLTPPGPAGNWDRPLLPTGEPLSLLILADTSASIDTRQRETQATFIAALLSSLTPKDTFNLAACDVTCDWTFSKAKSADAKNVTAAREFLAKRTSLGWTDLDRAFASALNRCGPKTHVIYVGDGIVTTGDADPVAFTKRLARLKLPSPPGRGAGGEGGPMFHSVALGSSYEAGVLKAIASLGGGSMRKITSEQGPTVVARELLGEIAQPALRDIRVEFKGFKAARVYPESLPNVPAGTQQILLGRYLPDGKDQSGEVIVTGTQGGKPVRFSTRASFKDAERGNSFIPRLWARMHLDSLLEQGSSAAIQDEIIALSEEYQIITPYTSFLVLETDADRERFKVKRRFLMRDGERFFADGRDNAVFDLRQKQMQRAGAWRTALRRSVLGELARLGREPGIFQPSPYGRHIMLAENILFKAQESEDGFLGGVPRNQRAEKMLVMDQTESLGEEMGLPFAPDKDKAEKSSELNGEPLGWRLGLEDAIPREDALLRRESEVREIDGGYAYFFRNAGWSGEDFKAGGLVGLELYGRAARSGPAYGQWLNTLFPALGGAPRPTKEPKSTWPAAARELAKTLLRTSTLTRLTGGIEITRQTDTFDARWGDLSSRSRRLELVSAKSWLTRSGSDGGQTLVSWCDAREIGVYSTAFQLGRVRASTPLDVQPPPLHLRDRSLTSLERAYPGYTPTLEPLGKDRFRLVLKYRNDPLYETRILIDTARHVILSIEDRHKGKVTSTTRFNDFVEAEGSWWACKIETISDAGKRTSLTTQTVKALSATELDKRTKAELAGRGDVQFLQLPLPEVKDAKKALVAGKAGFGDHFTLLLHFYRTQHWPRVLDHLTQAEKLAGKKPGLRWLHSAVLYDSRRYDDLRQRYLQDAARLAAMKGPDGNNRYFLAEYVVNQSSRNLEANEMLTLLNTLKPLYQKQPTHVHALKRWRGLQVSYVNQTGRADDALALRKAMAADYPRDYYLQVQYAQALAGAGDYPAAYAWLTRILVKDAKWLDGEEESLRNTYTQFLRQQGRYVDRAKYLAAWISENPARQTAYEQYLGALIMADQIDKADALALLWLKDAQNPGELPPATSGRLNAAVNFMLGNAHQLWSNRVEERWLAPLAQAALFFARHETHYSITGQILGNQHFRASEEAPTVRKKLGAILTGQIDKLPTDQVRRFVGWMKDEDIAPAAWKKIAATLRQRWDKETKDRPKDALGESLVSVLSRQEEPAELLEFLRVQLRTGPAKYRSAYANQLFNRLLAQPWSEKHEAELFTLLDQLSDADDVGRRLLSSVAALHRLTDSLIPARIAAGTKLLKHPEKLNRTDLLKKQADTRAQARAGVADRLRKEAGKHPKALAQWIVAESLYLDVLLDRNLKQVAAEAWEFVGAAPKKSNVEDSSVQRSLDDVLRQRYLVTLMNLAARKGANPALADRLLKYVEQGIALDEARWKPMKYRLLIAFDRVKELEKTLQEWTRLDDPDNRWRIALGYLLAEQGKMSEAIRELEAVEAADELSPSAYASLADWYLAQGQRAKHEHAAAAIYKTMPEYQISQRIAQKLNRWQRADGPVPTQLDPEVLRMFAVLFDKSNSPQAYLYHLQQFYQASHDFRFLSGLPDAVLGHTAQRVYPFVQGMKSVLDEVRDEATADEIVKRIAEVRPRAKSIVDQRALDLLEVLVERRAAEVVNQPGPHRERALAALVRASKRKWGPGEPRLMADFLAGLGKISQAALADEQLRQLKALRLDQSGRGSFDSLHIAHRHALTLNAYQRRAEAIDLLQVELQEFQAANKGVLPVFANEALASYLGLLEDAGHFARGESVLRAQLQNPLHAEQRRWLILRLDQLYHHALQHDGDVSLGKGATLYRSLHAKLQQDLVDTDQNHRSHLVTLLCQVYRTANDKKLPGVATDVRAFAFKLVPPLLKQQTNHHDLMVSIVAQVVHDLAGPRDGILFLLKQIDAEPRWLRYTNQNAWTRYGTTLGDWRREAKDLGPVEGQLLKLVLTELRRDLESRTARSREMYHQQPQQPYRLRFWAEKADDFARTAEAVLAERGKSGATAHYIADYLYWGLGRHHRAIEVLFVAHNQNLLDEPGQAKLVDFLHYKKRFGESIALLQPLVQRRPANLDYRVRLMHAYFRTARKAELLAQLKDTDAFFHARDRWTENPRRRLAESTLQNELFDQAVAYYKELIPLHERTHANRGIGNGTLSGYYTGLAKAYAGLKKSPEAVEAASGAIVAWGADRTNRAKALDTLTAVLLESPDLDAFVAHFNKQKQDSPIIRKALGQAYLLKKELGKAIKQLELAAELQPNDTKVYELLVASLDATGDKTGAVRQLLKAVQHSRRELKLYQDLGKRYADAKQPAEAERAYTSIVEMQANEAESHALLAEIRQKQDRWGDAIAHWEHVARLRALEPTGLLKLAAAQIHEKQWDRARATLRKLNARTWPARFNTIGDEIRALETKVANKSVPGDR